MRFNVTDKEVALPSCCSPPINFTTIYAIILFELLGSVYEAQTPVLSKNPPRLKTDSTDQRGPPSPKA